MHSEVQAICNQLNSIIKNNQKYSFKTVVIAVGNAIHSDASLFTVIKSTGVKKIFFFSNLHDPSPFLMIIYLVLMKISSLLPEISSGKTLKPT